MVEARLCALAWWKGLAMLFSTLFFHLWHLNTNPCQLCLRIHQHWNHFNNMEAETSTRFDSLRLKLFLAHW